MQLLGLQKGVMLADVITCSYTLTGACQHNMWDRSHHRCLAMHWGAGPLSHDVHDLYGVQGQSCKHWLTRQSGQRAVSISQIQSQISFQSPQTPTLLA